MAEEIDMDVKDMIETTDIRYKQVPNLICGSATSDLSLKGLPIRPRDLCGLPSCCDLVTILTRFYHLTNPSTGLHKRLVGIFQSETVKIM